MADLLGGILLPSSIFQTAWFQALAVFVALNTLVYVGLTFAKLVRWPSQLHPADVPRLTGKPDPLHLPEQADGPDGLEEP